MRRVRTQREDQVLIPQAVPNLLMLIIHSKHWDEQLRFRPEITDDTIEYVVTNSPISSQEPHTTLFIKSGFFAKLFTDLFNYYWGKGEDL